MLSEVYEGSRTRLSYGNTMESKWFMVKQAAVARMWVNLKVKSCLSGSQAFMDINDPIGPLLSFLSELKKLKKKGVFFSFLFSFFLSLFLFLSTVFPIPQRCRYSETELLINCFPKCSLKVATLLTSQTSPRTDWRLLVFPHGHQG